MMTRRLLVVALLGVMVTLGATACFNPFNPRIATTRSVSEPPPRPDTPRNLLLLFAWCWEHRDAALYRELFTDDFRFAFATSDTNGRAYLDRGFTRDDELASSTHLFLGNGPDQPPANRITLDFDPNLIALPDSRPGKSPTVHREIVTRVVLSVDTDEANTRINGSARFFVVNGDSASIPQELRDRGFGRDPNRWYIERYEEENSGQSAVSQQPSAKRGAAAESRLSFHDFRTWGAIKSFYAQGAVP